MRRSRALEPLEPHGKGRWRVRLAALAAAPEGAPALRRLLGAAAEGHPDDLLEAAAAFGALTNPALLDLLDGPCFAPAACLCCYEVRSAARAREAAEGLRLFLQYYSSASYVRSRAFPRLVETLARDLAPAELAEARAHLAALGSTPAAVRALNAEEGLCVAAPACQPGTLWVYSTPAGRRLLRRLSRQERRPLRVAVASSDPAAAPRHRYRMYAASFLPPESTTRPILAAALRAAGQSSAPA